MKKIVQLALFISIASASASTVNAKSIGHNKFPRTETTAHQISEAAATAQEAIKNVKLAPVTEKAMARQEANDAVENLLATLHERTWSGDLRGYTEDQIKEAGKKLELLNIAKNNLTKKITSQEAKIAKMTDTKFWGLWSSVKESIKEEEYNNAAIKLINLKIKFETINRAIHNQEVIAGKAYALSIKKAISILVPFYRVITDNPAESLHTKKYDLLVSKRNMLQKKIAQLSSEARNYVDEQSNLKYPEMPSLSYSNLQKLEKYLNELEKIINEELEREKKEFYSSKSI